MEANRIAEEKFLIGKDITKRVADFRKKYAKQKYGLILDDNGVSEKLQEVAEYRSRFSRATVPDILEINYDDLFLEGWMQWEVFLIDYNAIEGRREMGGWVAAQVKTKSGKSIRIRRDWTIPWHKNFDMTEEVKEAKREIKEKIIKIIIEAIDEKIDLGIDLTKYD